jgi:uncharacterized protein (DUF58 family)
MRAPGSRFLPPATLAALGDLQLVARTVVEGFLSGLHLDPRPGVGVEFSQYRAYQPGDDLRRLDWGVYARSGRYFVRQAEVERDVTVRLLLDATASMSHRSQAGESKHDVSRMLVACLAYLVERQGDHLAFHAVTGDGAVDLPTVRRDRALPALLHLLEELEPRGRWPSWEAVVRRFARRRRRELVVVVSDLWQQGDELQRTLAALKALGHEVLVVQLLARDELDFTWRGDLLFEDLESGETVQASAEALAGAYATRLEEELSGWRQRLLDAGIAYHLMATDEPLEEGLRRFLLRRRELP